MAKASWTFMRRSDLSKVLFIVGFGGKMWLVNSESSHESRISRRQLRVWVRRRRINIIWLEIKKSEFQKRLPLRDRLTLFLL